MSRILFAWEMGGNFGHIARDLPLALACRDAGHEVLFAVTDLNLCRAAATQHGLRFVQAPEPRLRTARRAGIAINFADMLLQNGFADADFLSSAVLGWHGLFDLFKPDLMVYDHAPRALLAARTRAVPVLLLGNGFEIPPRSIGDAPLPSFDPAKPAADHELLQAEHLLVDKINAVLTANGASEIGRLFELYDGSSVVMPCFPEFDHFGARAEAEYVGMASQLPLAKRIEWTAPEGHHVLVYLRANIPQIEHVFMALQQINAEIVCVVPDLPDAWTDRYSRLRFYREPLDLQALLPRASLMITHGAGTCAEAVAAGVPVLMVPSVIEQYLAGLQLERQGFGLMLRQRDSAASCADLMRQLVSDPTYRMAAKQLASRYAGFKPEQSVRRQLEVLERSLHVR